MVSGTALGHGITAAALPILTRLYSPTDFSLLAVFTGFVSIASVAACLRFDIAITIPEDQEEANKLLVLAVMCGIFTSFFLGVLLFLYSEVTPVSAKQPLLSSYFWLIPICVFLAGMNSAFQAWFGRKKEFALIARIRVVQSASAAGGQIGFGVLGISPFGLILGTALNVGSACLAFSWIFLKTIGNRRFAPGVSWGSLKAVFAKYDQFPKYSTLEALCNSAALNVPLVMIAALAIGPEAGYLTLAITIMQAPMALLGTAIGQVYVSQAVEEKRKGNLGAFTAAIFSKLLRFGVGPIIAVGILAPHCVGWVFGSQWNDSGLLIAWMTPWFAMQFLASPLSMALHIAGKQKPALILQFGGFMLRVLAIWIAHRVGLPLGETYAISNFVFYSVYLVVILHAAHALKADLIGHSLRAMPILTTWIAMAIAFVVLLMII